MGDESVHLSQEFLADYHKFAADFDAVLASSSFEGPKLDELAKSFLAIHGEYIQSFAFTVTASTNTKAPKHPGDHLRSSHGDVIDEDWRIVSGEQDAHKAPDHGKLLADLYRRACQACHLRVTFNKSRLNQEDNRCESVALGRHAIRYDPHNFSVCYWFMIALGWQLDVMTNPKERVLLARIFQQSTLRCIQLEPADGLAYNLLGRYYYSVAGLNWIERTVAKGLLGCKLEGSYQEAERQFMRAHELNQDWLPNALWLARVLLAQKRPMDEIKQWIDLGLKLDCKEPSTEIERNELLELRSKLKLSN